MERFQLKERGAVIAAYPESDRRCRTINEHTSDVGLPGQQVVGELPRLGVEHTDAVRPILGEPEAILRVETAAPRP